MKGSTATTSRAPGTVIRLEGGTGSFHGPHIGQAMAAADAAEGGYVHITGGEWSFYAPHFYRGDTADTVPAIYQTGGRVYGGGRHPAANPKHGRSRPILATSAPGGAAAGTGTYTSYCPDLSMNVT